jgi:hypothetical protein
MSEAFGDARTIPASTEVKTILKQLFTAGDFQEQRDAWRLGAALGISQGKVHEKGSRGTFQNINSLDDEGFFAAVMLGRYPRLTPEERLKKLVDHAEWGVREIDRMVRIGTFVPANYAVKESKT